MDETYVDKSARDENELINRVRAGETERFEQLLDPYTRAMYVLAYSVLRNDHDAEETVQESALKAFARLSQLRSNSSFKCWLLQITVNEARMRRRHLRLHPPVSIDDGQTIAHNGRAVALEFADYRENPEQALERKELEAVVNRACNGLAPKYRTILRLRCNDGLSVADIGKTLKLGIPAVKTQLHRARLSLRRQLVFLLAANQGARPTCTPTDLT